jgi:hypothetical protein
LQGVEAVHFVIRVSAVKHSHAWCLTMLVMDTVGSSDLVAKQPPTHGCREVEDDPVLTKDYVTNTNKGHLPFEGTDVEIVTHREGEISRHGFASGPSFSSQTSHS